jgi:deoxycytidine triphosphate deaminase
MTVLSDKSIQAAMDRQELILDGKPKYADGCSYEFKAGRVVYGGTDRASTQVTSVDLSRTPSQTAVIQPTAVVWVRSCERVSIPKNMVGLWVQTNSLSRSGLLLLNSTLVEPGYEGHLAAHFVNLGSSAVLLNSDTTIAKLLFLSLDVEAISLVDSSEFQNYDALIDKLAASSDRSFLRIGELTPDLESTARSLTANAEKRIREQTDAAVKEASERFTQFEERTYWRVGGGFVAGLALATLFSLWIYPKLREVDDESKTRIVQIVTERNEKLAKRLDEMQAELADIKLSKKAPDQPRSAEK